MTDLNYQPYFSEIEDAFIRRRGKGLILSPLDWALMESWKERAIPLHVVLRSIESVFDKQVAVRRRGISSLRYCQNEVEEQFELYVKSRVGSHDDKGTEGKPADPFSKEAIFVHLQRAAEKLLLAQASAPDTLQRAIGQACGTMATWSLDFSRTGDVRAIEEALTKIDEELRDAITIAATPDQVMECRTKVSTALAGYAQHMSDDVYQQTFGSLLNKHLRELFGIPRLSLFHMK